jgi:hypothetical protein
MAGQHARRTTPDETGDTERDQRLMRPDGQRYQAPESDATRSSKNVAYAALGLLVVVLLVLIATGTVRIFPT